MLTFEERRQAQQPVLFFPSATQMYFGWGKCLHPALCSLTWKALIAVGAFDDEESNLTMLLSSMLQGKSAGLGKGYQLALALEFEGLVTQFLIY